MQSDTATLYCPSCQTINPESYQFCQQCRTLLPRRYLWVIGGSELLRRGELLAGRYLVKSKQIVLDTQPGLVPEVAGAIPEAIEPYLKLAAYSLHVPQVYSLVSLPRQAPIVLLEQAPIYPAGAICDDRVGALMPGLTTVWKQSLAMRQLSWLWQMAFLWQPLISFQVASTLLQPDLLRVEGTLLRLQELHLDGRRAPTLKDLGRLWQTWKPGIQPEVEEFFTELCHQLQQGQVYHPEQLLMLLDRALAICGKNQTRKLQIATLTDQGPSRQRNEDACFPTHGTVLQVLNPGTPEATPADRSGLVIVCDGIGGHEGGNVASNLAITSVQQHLQPLLQPTVLAPQTLLTELEQAALIANDGISQRNDLEQRQERQRMGTTLVMAVAHGHELYLSHVGDSRAYRVTATGCHQITLDDDLAAREVRLGYTIYRQAVQQPGAGSLVQALGMSSSALLHPTVQRFVVEEDCLFLLCTDGLSDRDRVEEYWQTELLPVLQGTIDVATACQRLVSLANHLNGHDNVTVGLLHFRVVDRPLPPTPVAASLAQLPQRGEVGMVEPSSLQSELPGQTTRVIGQRSSSPVLLSLVGLLALVVAGSLLAYLLVPDLRAWVASIAGITSTSEPPPTPVPSFSPPATPPAPPPLAPPPLATGRLLQVKTVKTDSSGRALPLMLVSQPRATSPSPVNSLPAVGIPVGSVLQIASRQAIPDQGVWLKLRVCSIPGGTSPPPQATNVEGWIEEATIASLVSQNLALNATQLGKCAPSAPTNSK